MAQADSRLAIPLIQYMLQQKMTESITNPINQVTRQELKRGFGKDEPVLSEKSHSLPHGQTP
jgi:hypothetical protein